MGKSSKKKQEKHFNEVPKVSIVTVCYNSVKTIEDTIKSVINQSYSNVEYIVIDGGSTDGTIDIIRKYEKHIAKWISEPDEGIYDAMNKGILLASGELVGIINSDDWFLPETIDVVVNSYRTNQDVTVFHGNCKIINEHNEYIKKPLANFKEEKFKSMPINHPGSFIIKRAYDEIGLYSMNFRLASDYELILRFISKGKLFLYIDKTLTVMREGGVSSSDFVRSFNEARRVKHYYGCNRFLAGYYFLKSCSKTYIYKMLSQLPVINKYVFCYKNRNK
ncbi:MAG: glycosyltransferase family 2 protein [Alkaliphilus sp.]